MATSSFQLLRTKTLVLPSAPLSFLCPCSIFQQIHWAQSSEHMWNSITSQHLHRCHPGPNHHCLALGDDSCFWLSLFLPSRQFFTQQLVWAFKNISQVSLLSHNSQIAPMSLEKSSNSVTYNALCDLGITSPQPFSLLLSWSFPFALHQSHLSLVISQIRYSPPIRPCFDFLFICLRCFSRKRPTWLAPSGRPRFLEFFTPTSSSQHHRALSHLDTPHTLFITFPSFTFLLSLVILQHILCIDCEHRYFCLFSLLCPQR